MELASIIYFGDIITNPAQTPILFSTPHIPCSGWGGSFTGDPGGCVKEGSGHGHLPP